MGRKNKRKMSVYYRKLRMTSKNMQRSNSAEEHKTVSQGIPSPKRGEIWFAEFISHPGTSVQNGKRPALIISNDVSNQYAETVTVVPMTTRIKKPHLPTHVIAAPEDVDTAAGQYMELSMLLGEQVTTIGKCELLRYIGKIHNRKLKEVEEAVLAQVSIMDASVADEAMTDASLTADEAVADKITTAEIFEKEG